MQHILTTVTVFHPLQERKEEAIKVRNKILLSRGYSLPTDPLFDDLYG